MKERIRLLADSAHKSSVEQYYERMKTEHPSQVIFFDIFNQNFSELIVRECMDVVDTGENQLIARFQARQWLAEHFGIK